MANEELYQALKNADAAGDVEGARKLAAYIQSMSAPQVSQPSKPLPIGKEGFADALKQELADNPIAAKYAAAGTALSDLYQGTKQAFGFGDKEAIKNNEIIKDANHGSAILGNVALYAGTGMLSPVLNTVKGATAAGGVIGALSPTMDDNVVYGKAKNALLGAASSFAGAKGGQYIGNKIDAKKAAEALRQSQNATRDATLQATQQAGYVLPPSYANGSLPARIAESLSGKYKTNQAAQILNQRNTNNLAREYLGMPKGQAFSDDAINALKDVQNQAYRDVAALPPISNPFNGVAGGVQPTQSGKEVLNQLKEARFNSKLNWQHFNKTGDPAAYANAAKLDATAEQLENTLEAIAKNSNKTDLVDSLRASRRELAKIHTIDKAMNDATGDVDATVLAKMLTNDAPLSDQAKTIGRFSQAYGDVSRVPKSGDANPMTALDWMSTAVGAGISPYALALPVGRMASRAAILSPMAQKAMANPKYGVGPTNKLAEAIFSSRYSPMALTGATVPALAE